MMEPDDHFPALRLRCLLLVLAFTVEYSTSLVSNGAMPQELQECYNSYAHISLRDIVGQSACWSCEAPAIMRIRNTNRPPIITPSSARYISSLLSKISDLCWNGFKPPRTQKCYRREYRMLSDEERSRFHRAVNTLKEDTTVDPNKYDAIARLHSGNIVSSAHGGPTFPGWHRVYLLLFEMALQEVDPSLCLPYWDSSLDGGLEDPSSSYVFSPDFLGGGRDNRTVTDGPFAGWVTPDFGPLIRNIGASGQLFTLKDINNILAQTRTKDISPPNGKPQNGLEFHHNGIHVYIGGQMNDLQSSAHDPVFFLHHTFVDYLWEVFRNKQRTYGIDPELDYPEDYGSSLHSPYHSIGIHNLNITSMQGYSNKLKDTYDYEVSPSCSRYRPTCGSKYLQCKVQTGRCVPVDPNSGTSASKCSKSKTPVGIQNTFCINGVCDMRGWVYVPVKVVSMRSPDVKTYESYPVYNGSIWETNDIYQPAAYAETNRFIPENTPKKYHKCDDGNGIGQIFIQSSGLSYNGFYKESVIIDQRLATSIAIGYVAVMDPKHSPVKALFRAFDSCGRICNPGCRIPGTKEYRTCPGVLDIEDVPGRPKQYSQTYGEATLSTWGYSNNKDCPSFLENDISLTFYCDYKERIPWSRTQTKQSPSTGPSPASIRQQSPTRYECKINDDCTIDVHCDILSRQCSGERYKCRETCNTYAVCKNGLYSKKSCPFDWSFDGQTRKCNSHRRCSGSSAALYSPRYPYQTFHNNPDGSFNIQQGDGNIFGSARIEYN